jgi:hypothetical protein
LYSRPLQEGCNFSSTVYLRPQIYVMTLFFYATMFVVTSIAGGSTRVKNCLLPLQLGGSTRVENCLLPLQGVVQGSKIACFQWLASIAHIPIVSDPLRFEECS